jgi:hypothetical protein
MAKQQIDDKIQAKFEKPQFSIEDAVYFSFLGQKQYGYVTKITPVNWGVKYTVQASNGLRYPCGISIEGIKTSYDAGFIYFEESRDLGSDECRRRYESARNCKSINAVPRNTRRTEIESTDGDQTSKPNVDTSVGKMDANTKRRNSTKNVVKPSADGVSPSNRKKRSPVKNVELDDAIKKQKDFLNGFIKRT